MEHEEEKMPPLRVPKITAHYVGEISHAHARGEVTNATMRIALKLMVDSALRRRAEDADRAQEKTPADAGVPNTT